MDVWFLSDHHFGHSNLIFFEKEDGSLMRPNPQTGEKFSCIEEHDELLIEMHNSVVKENDRVYLGGDFSFNPNHALKMASRMNGSMALIVGNHDPIQKISAMKRECGRKLFRDVVFWKYFSRGVFGLNDDETFVMSHLPLRDDGFRHKVSGNVHGHDHSVNFVSDRHFNICIESIGFIPMNLEELKMKVSRET